VSTVEALADMTPEQLEAIEGIGPKTVEKISLAVNNYFASLDAAEAGVAPEEAATEEAAPEEYAGEVRWRLPRKEPARRMRWWKGLSPSQRTRTRKCLCRGFGGAGRFGRGGIAGWGACAGRHHEAEPQKGSEEDGSGEVGSENEIS